MKEQNDNVHYKNCNVVNKLCLEKARTSPNTIRTTKHYYIEITVSLSNLGTGTLYQHNAERETNQESNKISNRRQSKTMFWFNAHTRTGHIPHRLW